MKNINKNSIGIFDSGFGGLNVMREVINILPKESIIYFGDTAHLPYGTKSKENIIKFSLEITDFLISKKIKTLVIACNSASSHAISSIKKSFDIPLIEVISPGVKAAIEKTKNKKIGIIGTSATIDSNSYQKKIPKKYKVFTKSCPLFVPIVEEGLMDSDIALETAKMYLAKIKKNGIDTLILGCTHYPFLKKTLEKILDKIFIVDSAKYTAIELKNFLAAKSLLNTSEKKPKYKFFVTDDPKKFKKMGSNFLGKEIKFISKIHIE